MRFMLEAFRLFILFKINRSNVCKASLKFDATSFKFSKQMNHIVASRTKLKRLKHRKTMEGLTI